LKAIPPIEDAIRRAFGSGAETRPFGVIEWAVGAEAAVAAATFDDGGDNVEHTHPNCEEIVYVLEGEIEHTLGEASSVLRAGDLIIVPRDIPHRLMNRSGAPCRMLIAFTHPDREFVPTGR
jgi:quercetin dioxygenase-like cupin family protein